MSSRTLYVASQVVGRRSQVAGSCADALTLRVVVRCWSFVRSFVRSFVCSFVQSSFVRCWFELTLANERLYFMVS